ncbi:hypothetical protein GCM10009861_01420 [Neomicrococcus aestuarii]
MATNEWGFGEHVRSIAGGALVIPSDCVLLISIAAHLFAFPDGIHGVHANIYEIADG